MFTRQKSVVSRPQIRSPRIARAVELKREKQLRIRQIEEMEPAKKIASTKRKAPKNVLSPQMKRKPKLEVATPNKRKKIKVLKDISEKHGDTYCWLCHKICLDRTCGCKRVYHNKCLEDTSLVFKYNKCPECQVKTENRPDLTRPFTKGLKVYLESAIQLITDKHKNKKLSWSRNTDLIGGINIETLLKKVKDGVYKTTAEFFSDVKWLYHNSCILYGENSKQTKDMNIVINNFKEELYDMEACPECYYHLNCMNGNDSYNENNFARLCNPPHDIVWARVHGHPYWPAKVLKVTNGKARIRFFGKHEKADVATNTIFHISELHPTHKHRNIRAGETHTSLDYTYAKKELFAYIRIYEKNVGNFQFSERRLFYVPINDGSRTFSETQELTKEACHTKNTQSSVISTNSPAFSRLPSSSMSSIPSEPYATANLSSNCDVLSNVTVCVDTPPPESSSSDIRNCPSTNFTLPSRVVLPCLQNVENTLDPSTPSENSSFQSTSSNPTSSYVSPCSTTNLSGFKVKEENCDLDETYRISSVYSSSPTSGNLLQLLFQDVTDEDPEEFPVVKEEIIDSEPTTSELEGKENESNVFATNKIPSIMENLVTSIWSESIDNCILARRISQTNGESNVISTENVTIHIPSVGPSVQTENKSNTNSTEKVLDISSSEMDQTDHVSNIKAQQSLQDETAALPSSSKITEIDLTGDDDDDNSSMRFSNVFIKNPEMRQLLVNTQKQLGHFITRVCEEVCYQQKPEPTQLCQTLTRKLNETEKKFQEEANRLRDQIENLQKKLDEKK